MGFNLFILTYTDKETAIVYVTAMAWLEIDGSRG